MNKQKLMDEVGEVAKAVSESIVKMEAIIESHPQ